MYFFEFKIRPQVKERPRARVMRRGAKAYATMYTPDKTLKYQNTLATHARKFIDKIKGYKPFDEAMAVWVFTLKATAHKTDIDNHLKSLFDGLNEVIWTDDNLIKNVHASMAIDRHDPRTLFAVTTLEAYRADPEGCQREWMKYVEDNVNWRHLEE